ncbi:hypothetical protein PanWU01x14_088830 [Parasponia andersonii]|uniref:F-box protein At3g26010-like beta-propeller domain-containing protein n=1 Tax=Parasponia andersonii TaxID=3476 RepID=A0A2P5D846_PARAD|nr:hypothetical protein PanWU01x14_088830 [Parasponia andersonii]
MMVFEIEGEEEEQRLRIKKIEKSKSMFDYIPDDLVHEILIRLPNLKSAVQSYVYVFSSETGQWSILGQNLLLRTLESNDVVSSNGVLYWIHLRFKKLVAFYPFRVKSSHTKQWRVIPLPDGFKYPGGTGDEDSSHAQLRLGLYQGRPRLSQLFRVDSQHLCLKVWDLTYNNGDVNAESSSPLVHHVKIEAADLNSMSVSVLAFHPSHNNQIFMLRNRKLYLYDIETKKQVEVAEIHSDSNGKMPDLPIFPFVHPVRPTLV